jgi:hypothetical protein
MRHPFDGIVAPKANRRSWLKVFAGALAGWFGYATVSQAVGPPRKVKKGPDADPEPPKPVTAALNEQGGNPATLALNEQGGPMTRALNEQGRMTKAKGEQGGIRPRPVVPPGRATTLALGEEGGTN